MTHIVETLDYRGYEIEIQYDQSPQNPRIEFDNLGTMWCDHSRYHLGDHEQYRLVKTDSLTMWEELARVLGCYSQLGYNHPDYTTEVQNNRAIELAMSKVVWVPLYLYDHSGITMNTTGFSCGWDSGLVGMNWVTKETLRNEYGWKRITKARRDQIQRTLRAEVDEYDTYLRGDVYGYVVQHPTDDFEDSCWGFYGDDHDKNGLLEYAHSAIDSRIDYLRQGNVKAVKTMLSNHVPLHKRAEFINNVRHGVNIYL